MRLTKLFSTVLFVTLFSMLASCASGPSKEGTGEYMDDSVITTKVKAMILSESTLKSAEINVETFKGIVQLTGFVSSQDRIDKALEVAGNVNGVISVRNGMELK